MLSNPSAVMAHSKIFFLMNLSKYEVACLVFLGLVKFVHGKTEKAIFIHGLSTFCRATPNKARAIMNSNLFLGSSMADDLRSANAVEGFNFESKLTL